jgi:hypothetical protein
VFTGVFSALVCAVELASARLPMLVHVRPWQGRGGWGRFVGRFVLPGWPSALAFMIVVAGLSTLALQLALRYAPNVTSEARLLASWLITLALGALVFPTLALAFFAKTAARSASSLYSLTFGLMCVVAVSAGVMAAAFPLKYAALVLYARVLPVAGFWLSVIRPQDLSTKAIVCQAVLLVVVVAVAAWQTRSYWQWLNLLEARAKLEKK